MSDKINQDKIEENSTIERILPSDNFTLLSNGILQDPDISSDATMVAVFILSLPKYKKDGSPWDIHPKHVYKSKNISRDRVYKAFNELIKRGYMLRITKKRGNLNDKVTYRISCLKQFLRHPEFQDTESQYPENQEHINNIGEKDISKEEEEEEAREAGYAEGDPVYNDLAGIVGTAKAQTIYMQAARNKYDLKPVVIYVLKNLEKVDEPVRLIGAAVRDCADYTEKPRKPFKPAPAPKKAAARTKTHSDQENAAQPPTGAQEKTLNAAVTMRCCNDIDRWAEENEKDVSKMTPKEKVSLWEQLTGKTASELQQLLEARRKTENGNDKTGE